MVSLLGCCCSVASVVGAILLSYYTSACSSSFVSIRTVELTSPSSTTRRTSFNGAEERTTTEVGLLRSYKGRQLRWSRCLATRHARAAENGRRIVVGTGRLYSTQTGETSFQETTRHHGWSTSAVAGRSRRSVEFEKNDIDGMTFLLTVIDVFSKVAQCVPMKNKTAASLVAALTTTFTDYWPKTLQTDQGLEFLNKSVQALLQKCGIHH